jgi:hypothetical protein
MDLSFLLLIMVAVAIASLVAVTPRCPECGSLLSVRDTLDSSLRHCRRCMTIFRQGERR